MHNQCAKHFNNSICEQIDLIAESRCEESAWLLVEVVEMLGEVACVMGAMGTCAGAAAMIGMTFGVMDIRGILSADDVL